MTITSQSSTAKTLICDAQYILINSKDCTEIMKLKGPERSYFEFRECLYLLGR